MGICSVAPQGNRFLLQNILKTCLQPQMLRFERNFYLHFNALKTKLENIKSILGASVNSEQRKVNSD